MAGHEVGRLHGPGHPPGGTPAAWPEIREALGLHNRSTRACGEPVWVDRAGRLYHVESGSAEHTHLLAEGGVEVDGGEVAP